MARECPSSRSSSHVTGWLVACRPRTGSQRKLGRARRSGDGFTLVELMIAVMIIGLLAALTGRMYMEYIDRARIIQAMGDIKAISVDIDNYKIQNGELPPSLVTVGRDDLLDPWGNPYAYLNIEAGVNRGAVRKDRNLVPINTDYDLYSKGKDGASVPPLTADVSLDDIIRGNNGGFIGLASNY